MIQPTVADLLNGTWEPAPWPEGYACIYKATLVGTTRAYVGKTKDLRVRFKDHMRDDEYIDRALNAHGPENFSIEVLWVALSEANAYAQEDSFIEKHRTHKDHGGFNITSGGKGYTSEEARKVGAIGGEVVARRAGYPSRRVLAELEKGPRTIASMAAALGLTRQQIKATYGRLRLTGHHIIGEWGGLFRLVTLKEAADHWACGRELSNIGRVFGLLMEGPRTRAELAAASGMPRDSVNVCIQRLRENGYNIESRGATKGTGEGGTPGTYHMTQDKRHPWLHLGTMDLRGAAWDDPSFSLQYRK